MSAHTLKRVNRCYETAVNRLASISRKGVTEKEIEKHKSLRIRCQQLDNEVVSYNDLLGNLKTLYAAHKGEFAIIRYMELKRSIKQTIDYYQRLVNGGGGRRRSRSLGTIQSVVTPPARSGLLNSLLSGAREFAERSNDPDTDEDSYNNISKKELTAMCDALDTHYQNQRRRIESCKDALSILAESYLNSKSSLPLTRYGLMKDMIKEAVYGV